MTNATCSQTVGLREWITLPELGTGLLRAKIDTGAHTSSLHATDIEAFEKDGQRWVRFTAHFGTAASLSQTCQAPIVDERNIKSSNGVSEKRYVIRTLMVLGTRAWEVDISLADRARMRYRVLIGVRALKDGDWLVDPSKTYVQPQPTVVVPETP